MRSVFLLLAMFCLCTEGFAEEAPKDVSFSPLSESNLVSEMKNGLQTLEKALLIQKEKPGALISVEAKYYAWMGQCLDEIAANEESSLWKLCLNFSSHLLQVPHAAETSMALVPVYKAHKKKWKSTLLQLPKDDQDFLRSQLETGLAMGLE